MYFYHDCGMDPVAERGDRWVSPTGFDTSSGLQSILEAKDKWQETVVQSLADRVGSIPGVVSGFT